jgi:hypothetical protein
VQALLLPAEKVIALRLLLSVVNVPLVSVNVLFNCKASPIETVALGASTINGPKFLPAEIIVEAAVIVFAPTCVQVMPVTSVMLPATVIAVLPAIVPVKPVQLIDFAPVLPVEMVQVTVPDAESKNTSSLVVGIDSPPAPPDVAAHFVPTTLFHVVVPPTQ